MVRFLYFAGSTPLLKAKKKYRDLLVVLVRFLIVDKQCFRNFLTSMSVKFFGANMHISIQVHFALEIIKGIGSHLTVKNDDKRPDEGEK